MPSNLGYLGQEAKQSVDDEIRQIHHLMVRKNISESDLEQLQTFLDEAYERKKRENQAKFQALRAKLQPPAPEVITVETSPPTDVSRGVRTKPTSVKIAVEDDYEDEDDYVPEEEEADDESEEEIVKPPPKKRKKKVPDDSPCTSSAPAGRGRGRGRGQRGNRGGGRGRSTKVSAPLASPSPGPSTREESHTVMLANHQPEQSPGQRKRGSLRGPVWCSSCSDDEEWKGKPIRQWTPDEVARMYNTMTQDRPTMLGEFGSSLSIEQRNAKLRAIYFKIQDACAAVRGFKRRKKYLWKKVTCHKQGTLKKNKRLKNMYGHTGAPPIPEGEELTPEEVQCLQFYNEEVAGLIPNATDTPIDEANAVDDEQLAKDLQNQEYEHQKRRQKSKAAIIKEISQRSGIEVKPDTQFPDVSEDDEGEESVQPQSIQPKKPAGRQVRVSKVKRTYSPPDSETEDTSVSLTTTPSNARREEKRRTRSSERLRRAQAAAEAAASHVGSLAHQRPDACQSLDMSQEPSCLGEGYAEESGLPDLDDDSQLDYVVPCLRPSVATSHAPVQMLPTVHTTTAPTPRNSRPKDVVKVATAPAVQVLVQPVSSASSLPPAQQLAPQAAHQPAQQPAQHPAHIVKLQPTLQPDPKEFALVPAAHHSGNRPAVFGTVAAMQQSLAQSQQEILTKINDIQSDLSEFNDTHSGDVHSMKTTTAQTSTNVGKVVADCKTLKSKLVALALVSDSVKNHAEDTKTNVIAMGNDMSSMKEDLQSQDTNITVLRREVQELNEHQLAMKGDITTLQKEVRNLSKGIDLKLEEHKKSMEKKLDEVLRLLAAGSGRKSPTGRKTPPDVKPVLGTITVEDPAPVSTSGTKSKAVAPPFEADESQIDLSMSETDPNRVNQSTDSEVHFKVRRSKDSFYCSSVSGAPTSMWPRSSSPSLAGTGFKSPPRGSRRAHFVEQTPEDSSEPQDTQETQDTQNTQQGSGSEDESQE